MSKDDLKAKAHAWMVRRNQHLADLEAGAKVGLVFSPTSSLLSPGYLDEPLRSMVEELMSQESALKSPPET